MGDRGPAKTPQAVHKSRGTYKPSRHGVGSLPVQIPAMPPDLPPTAQSAWNTIVGKLEQAGICSDIDGTALRLLAESIWLYHEAQDAVREKGITVVTLKGNVIQNPAVGVRNKAWAQIVKLCQQFGMTPSSRTGMNLDPEADDGAEAADIIGFAVA